MLLYLRMWIITWTDLSLHFLFKNIQLVYPTGCFFSGKFRTIVGSPSATCNKLSLIQIRPMIPCFQSQRRQIHPGKVFGCSPICRMTTKSSLSIRRKVAFAQTKTTDAYINLFLFLLLWSSNHCNAKKNELFKHFAR